ncbi:hypothetical protein EI94DRAFT_1074211 [Lactarius quietus]|nr:hypothetical protein EI94DRAFT_1074211 [Lactarius quietus]
MPVSDPTTFNVTHHSFHSPRDVTRHGLQHVTIIVIAVSASVGGVLVLLLCWHFLSRSSRSRKSAPLPPRQALVHQREQQLAAFTEHQNTSVPQIFIDERPSAPVRQGSNASLIPHINNISPNNSYRVSLYETDDGTEGLSSAHAYTGSLHPPTPPFSAAHLPHRASSSSTSLPLSNDNISEPTSPAATTLSPNHSQRRSNPRPRPRPFSVASNCTSHTGMTARSRSSMRGAPHAPHINLQIVLPAPLAPSLYPPVVDEHGRRSLISDTTYSGSWRSSLADKWIPVGQQSNPDPKPVKRQRSHDSMVERRGRHAQKEASMGPIPQRRNNSNPPTPSHLVGHLRRRSLDNSLLDSPPPVPRVPSAYVPLPRRDVPALLEHEVLPGPSSSFPNSRRLRS